MTLTPPFKPFGPGSSSPFAQAPPPNPFFEPATGTFLCVSPTYTPPLDSTFFFKERCPIKKVGITTNTSQIILTKNPFNGFIITFCKASLKVVTLITPPDPTALWKDPCLACTFSLFPQSSHTSPRLSSTVFSENSPPSN